jgi:hypothetical protein
MAAVSFGLSEQSDDGTDSVRATLRRRPWAAHQADPALSCRAPRPRRAHCRGNRGSGERTAEEGDGHHPRLVEAVPGRVIEGVAAGPGAAAAAAVKPGKAGYSKPPAWLKNPAGACNDTAPAIAPAAAEAATGVARPSASSAAAARLAEPGGGARPARTESHGFHGLRGRIKTAAPEPAEQLL